MENIFLTRLVMQNFTTQLTLVDIPQKALFRMLPHKVQQAIPESMMTHQQSSRAAMPGLRKLESIGATSEAEDTGNFCKLL